MAAFRGRSLLFFGFDGTGSDGAVVEAAAFACVGIDFCASPSLRLAAPCKSCDDIFSCDCAPDRSTPESPPAIDVSGIPAFRGGGISGSSVCGLYAVAVCSCLFDD